MKLFLLVFLISFGLYAQDQSSKKETIVKQGEAKIVAPKNGEIRTYYDAKGNKITDQYDKVTTWNVDTPDGLHKKDDPIMKSRIYYQGRTDIKEKVEKYRRLDGSLSSIIYYKNALRAYEENYYSKDYTIRDGRRGILKSRYYYYSDCKCAEIYNGSIDGKIQYKVIYKNGKETIINPTSSIKDLSCKEQDCSATEII